MCIRDRQIPILTIESINPVKVKVNVSESYYNRVTKGMPVEVVADALGDALFQGNVSLIHPTIDPVSHTFTVEVSVANSEQLLRPGMFARVRMHFGTNERPLLPDYAVLKQLGSNDRYVFVEKAGKAIHTPVELGIRPVSYTHLRMAIPLRLQHPLFPMAPPLMASPTRLLSSCRWLIAW